LLLRPSFVAARLRHRPHKRPLRKRASISISAIPLEEECLRSCRFQNEVITQAATKPRSHLVLSSGLSDSTAKYVFILLGLPIRSIDHTLDWSKGSLRKPFWEHLPRNPIILRIS
jgi:hypothetical protein